MDRSVLVDPDGYLDHDWMAVIVEADTGVRYRHQFGGTACRLGTVQGYWVPVFFRPAYIRLTALFENTLQGAGTWNRHWTDDALAELTAAVALIPMAPSVPVLDDRAVPLRLDASRLASADEAWVPVLSPDGSGRLIWPNSD